MTKPFLLSTQPPPPSFPTNLQREKEAQAHQKKNTYIQSTVSATSSGVPSTPIGTSTQQSSAHPLSQTPPPNSAPPFQKKLLPTLGQLLRIPRQHFRIADQRRRDPIHRYALRCTVLTQPMDQAVQCRFRRPVRTHKLNKLNKRIFIQQQH